jgi:hypothetical protein
VSGDDLSRLPAGDPPLPAGAQAARRRLVRFIRDGDADRYDRTRDLPGEDATSHLSAYLRLGMCTAPQIGRGLGLPGDLPPGREAFWRQVCWREFLHHHLARHPQVLRGALLPEFRRIEWEDDDDGLAAWTRGETGFPIVDAGMRQLAQEGWVHNRARMVVASFLVKDLGIDWRRGETAFMRGLVDGDPASNNGGWQWVAGTGTDAAPYFRVLNPVLQSRRFDPAGAYIRRHVPELRDVPDDRIHEPWRMDDAQQAAVGCRIGRDYPAPVLDHGERRERALERYRRVGGRGPPPPGGRRPRAGAPGAGPVGQHHQAALELRDRLEVLAVAGALRGGLALRGVHGQHLADLVDHHADDQGLHLDDDDLGLLGTRSAHPEPGAEVHHRDDPAAEVDDALDMERAPRDRPRGAVPDDLLHQRDRDAVLLLREGEHDQLVREGLALGGRHARLVHAVHPMRLRCRGSALRIGRPLSGLSATPGGAADTFATDRGAAGGRLRGGGGLDPRT